jgi:signal transduction histidine kinase
MLRVLSDMQEQADDLFALYQITQFLNNSNELDLLCSRFLHELERITLSDVACLYLASPAEGLFPAVWHGLDSTPPSHADSDSALQWLREQPGVQLAGLDVLSLPLMAEERMVGIALLAHAGASARVASLYEGKARFLQTVAKEMGTALLVMEGRQALLAQEQKLEAIVASTTDAIIQVGVDQQIRDFNPAAERLTGYSTSDALTRMCADIFGCPDELKVEGSKDNLPTFNSLGGCGGRCPFVQVLAEREPIPYAEIVIAGGGSGTGKRHIAASVAALDLGKEMPAAVGILRDMSKQKQIEQMKSDFLATVSHQLRTPLALLRGYIDTLLHLELSPQEQSNCIADIADTTSRLERLVTQILDVTRIEEGRMELQREPVRLVDLLRVAISSLPLVLHRSRLWAEVPPDLPLLDADPHRLEQVLINLLDNALKYSPPTGQVVIRAKEAGSYVEVQVLDEGIGILPEEREAVFDKFQRGGNARNLQLPGTGLGLFICRSIIEAHGGEISVSAGPEGGTQVTFRVPAILTES